MFHLKNTDMKTFRLRPVALLLFGLVVISTSKGNKAQAQPAKMYVQQAAGGQAPVAAYTVSRVPAASALPLRLSVSPGVYTTWIAENKLVKASQKNRSKEGFRLKVYPNPAREQFNIAFVLDESAEVDIRVIDMMGNVWRSYSGDGVSGGVYHQEIDLGDAPDGVYFVQVRQNDEVRIHRLIKGAN